MILQLRFLHLFKLCLSKILPSFERFTKMEMRTKLSFLRKVLKKFFRNFQMLKIKNVFKCFQIKYFPHAVDKNGRIRTRKMFFFHILFDRGEN